MAFAAIWMDLEIIMLSEVKSDRESQKYYLHTLSRFSHVWLFPTLWTVVHQAPLSMGFSRKYYWNRFPWPHAGHLPNPRIESESLCLLYCQAVSFSLEIPGKPILLICRILKKMVQMKLQDGNWLTDIANKLMVSKANVGGATATNSIDKQPGPSV